MSCERFGHAWNWSPGRWGFLWLRKGGHFWCYHCTAVDPTDAHATVRDVSEGRGA